MFLKLFGMEGLLKSIQRKTFENLDFLELCSKLWIANFTKLYELILRHTEIIKLVGIA